MNCDIIFNVKKSKCMCIKLQKCTITNVLSIKLNDSCIDLVTEYKYLHVKMCSSNKDEEAIAGQILSLYR